MKKRFSDEQIVGFLREAELKTKTGKEPEKGSLLEPEKGSLLNTKFSISTFSYGWTKK